MSNLRPKNPRVFDADAGDVATAGSARAESSVSDRFRHELDTARKALERGFGRVRHPRAKAGAAAPVGTVPSDDLVSRLREGLRKEREFVLTPLLDRLDGFARRLLDGKPVPAAWVEEGLELVERYRVELHDAHLRLFEITEVEVAIDPSARLTYDALIADFEHARVRWATVRVMVAGYESKYSGYRGLLGLTLSQQCRAEKAWHEFEEQYVRTSLPTMFTPALAQTWQADLDKARTEGRSDHAKVDDFLARTAGYAAEPG